MDKNNSFNFSFNSFIIEFYINSNVICLNILYQNKKTSNNFSKIKLA